MILVIGDPLREEQGESYSGSTHGAGLMPVSALALLAYPS